MKIFFKALLFCFVTLIVVCIISVIVFNSLLSNNLSKGEIVKLVEEYSDVILADIKENNFEDTLAIKGVTDVRMHNVIDIQCGGKGFGSATSYYGFYYSESDEPIVIFNGYISNVNGNELIFENKGYFYSEMNSDNSYYTERISDGFYYYEWHF